MWATYIQHLAIFPWQLVILGKKSGNLVSVKGGNFIRLAILPAKVHNMLTLKLYRTFQILIANEMAGELFGFTNNDLVGLQLNDLITLKQKAPMTIGESHLEDSGEIVEVCGKVVDAIDSSGTSKLVHTVFSVGEKWYSSVGLVSCNLH